MQIHVGVRAGRGRGEWVDGKKVTVHCSCAPVPVPVPASVCV